MKTDKSGKIAVVDQDQYFLKMEECIQQLTYSVLVKDPNPAIHRKTQELLRNSEWPPEIKD